MKGLDLAEAYYEEYGRPMMAEHFGVYVDRIAVGFAGEGSDCFGFDDELSRDHDWGPGFCMWLTSRDYARFGAELQACYDMLPKTCRGFGCRQEDPHAGKRTGTFEITDFYRRFIGYDHVPARLAEWRSIPEPFLATATNGRVFTDPLGEFTAFRMGLLAFYPEDVRLKKLAARLASAGQAGQYNYSRCIARRELVAATSALSRFVEATISIIFLLNKRYTPFYKWAHRAMRDLPVLGERCYRSLAELCAEPGRAGTSPATSSGAATDRPDCGARGSVDRGLDIFEMRERMVEEISDVITGELRAEGLSDCVGDFLVDHAYAVQARIEDEPLRRLHVMVE